MSDAVIEAWESEASGFEGEGEAIGEGYDSEGHRRRLRERSHRRRLRERSDRRGVDGYGEESRADARRRRQRQMLPARQAQMRRQPSPPSALRRPAPPPPQRVVAPAPAQDRLSQQSGRRCALATLIHRQPCCAFAASSMSQSAAANRKTYRNSWAAEASVAASQALDSFKSVSSRLVAGSHSRRPDAAAAPGKAREARV